MSDKKLDKKETEKLKKLKQKDENRKKRNKAVFKWGMIGCFSLIIIITLLVLGVLGGVYGYPKALEWLSNSQIGTLIGVTKTDEGNIDTGILPSVKNNTVEVVTEESAIINVVEETSPSVVSIAVNSTIFNPGQGVVDQTANIGTGFFVEESGIIATNQHVVSETGADYIVIDADGNEYDVLEIVRDDLNDIALLKIEEGNYPSLDLASKQDLAVGQMVVAIGTPLGEYPGSVSVGIISGLDRNVTTGADSLVYRGETKSYENVIQTDAAVNSGNSGGPLLNLQGQVIGINFAKTNADNISFALPVDVLQSRLDEYLQYGKFLKPYLGVEYQNITQSQARFYSNVVAGAFLTYIEPQSPADEAGLERGDIIVAIDGDETVNQFSRLIQSKEIGETIVLTVYRDGKEIQLDAVTTRKRINKNV
ncbi:trypsin-like peptidase domain-containing protein [Candidatus Woesebacteria bacterium]|nr:trypsin-like peptidase domain-containing protein [Candidatus Woesebacteria bacterium]